VKNNLDFGIIVYEYVSKSFKYSNVGFF